MVRNTFQFLSLPHWLITQGIAPTIIAVRVGLGKSVENVGSFATRVQPRVHAPLELQDTVVSGQSIEQGVLHLRPESESDCAKAEIV